MILFEGGFFFLICLELKNLRYNLGSRLLNYNEGGDQGYSSSCMCNRLLILSMTSIHSTCVTQKPSQMMNFK